jgi:hypothetical protein
MMGTEDESEHPWIGSYVLNDEGNPVPEHDVLKWAEWLEAHDRHLATTNFSWGKVSTIFLGLDERFLSFCLQDPLLHEPVLWETMVFGGPLNGEQRRYTSKEEALEGHRHLVEECKEAEKHCASRFNPALN